MPSGGVESWTVIGPDRRPVPVVDEFLTWLTNIEGSPNTVEAYAHDRETARWLPWRSTAEVISRVANATATACASLMTPLP